MASIMDYILWRGDLPLRVSPLSPADMLILSQLAYTDPGPEARSSEGAVLRELLFPASAPGTPADSWLELARSAAASLRYGSMRLHDYVNVVDPERDIQFSAVTASLPDGRSCVCFRGTDNTLVGWREDFTMAFESPVPAQMEALTYLERISLRTGGGILLTGHSKGGNLAVYAAARASAAAQAQIQSVYTFDGPGVDDETFLSDGYRRIGSRIHSFIPQSSVIGLLLAYHPDYTVVRSGAEGFRQHDAFTWQLIGPRFEELSEVDAGSRLINETVHEWLRTVSPQQRRTFVNTLFDVLEASGASTLRDLKADRVRSALGMIAAGRELDGETLRMMGYLVGSFLTIGMGNLWDAILHKPRQLLQTATHYLESTQEE
ncbi:MAG: DUF2974 domain-containing protein [Clostridia bacterium]|nr:DUF2974 domain-containing protein [Clostridia bacterium]